MVWKKLLLIIAVSLLGATASWAQTGVLTGQVTEAETRAALPGANVVIIGTSIGTSTDLDGSYTLDGLEPGTYDVRASFVGFRAEVRESVTITAGDTSFVDFELRTGVTLDEMVVIGYGEQQRRNLTGSVASVSASDIEDRPIESVEEALQGKAAGINIIQDSGSPVLGVHRADSRHRHHRQQQPALRGRRRAGER